MSGGDGALYDCVCGAEVRLSEALDHFTEQHHAETPTLDDDEDDLP